MNRNTIYHLLNGKWTLAEISYPLMNITQNTIPVKAGSLSWDFLTISRLTLHIASSLPSELHALVEWAPVSFYTQPQDSPSADQPSPDKQIVTLQASFQWINDEQQIRMRIKSLHSNDTMTNHRAVSKYTQSQTIKNYRFLATATDQLIVADCDLEQHDLLNFLIFRRREEQLPTDK